MRARRAFAITWIALTVAGALNQTVLAQRLELLLPHLKYGHVMFNHNPRDVMVHSYLDSAGVRHDLADLMETAALGYQRARLAVTIATKPDYPAELCLHAQRRHPETLIFLAEEFHDGQPTTTHRLRCDEHGLTQE